MSIRRSMLCHWHVKTSGFGSTSNVRCCGGRRAAVGVERGEHPLSAIVSARPRKLEKVLTTLVVTRVDWSQAQRVASTWISAGCQQGFQPIDLKSRRSKVFAECGHPFPT